MVELFITIPIPSLCFTVKTQTSIISLDLHTTWLNNVTFILEYINTHIAAVGAECMFCGDSDVITLYLNHSQLCNIYLYTSLY